jgi:K+-transporting ATPase KdpF subunit
MNDIIYIGVTIISFLVLGLFTWACAKFQQTWIMENLIVGIVSVGLIIYLLFTILRPEKF